MSEENKAIVRRFWEEAFNTGNLAVVDEIFAPDYGHITTGGTMGHGPEHVKQTITRDRIGFPDFRFTIEEMIAEGDKVVVRWTARGTHQGVFRGIPPTGKQVTITGVEIHRVVGGKIVAGWRKWDRMDVMQQLGVTDITLYRAGA